MYRAVRYSYSDTCNRTDNASTRVSEHLRENCDWVAARDEFTHLSIESEKKSENEEEESNWHFAWSGSKTERRIDANQWLRCSNPICCETFTPTLRNLGVTGNGNPENNTRNREQKFNYYGT